MKNDSKHSRQSRMDQPVTEVNKNRDHKPDSIGSKGSFVQGVGTRPKSTKND